MDIRNFVADRFYAPEVIQGSLRGRFFVSGTWENLMYISSYGRRTFFCTIDLYLDGGCLFLDSAWMQGQVRGDAQ